jgi:O-antigen/teichoic acid export membrane protein
VRGGDPAGARRLKGRLLAMRLGAAAALTALMAVVLLLVPMPGDLRGAIAGASLFFLAYAAFPDWALRAREAFRGLAMANAAAAAALIAGTLLLLPLRPTAGMAAALWSGSFAIAALVSLARLLPARAFAWHGASAPLRTHARHSLVFAVGAIGGIGCAQAPMLVVGLLATPVDAGLFGAGYRFLLVVINAFSVLWWPLMPVLVRSRPGERDFREALAAMWSVVLLLGLPAFLAFTLWPAELLTLAFGPRYAAGAATLRVAGIVVPLFAATALLEQTCLALGGEVVRARVNALALALLVGASVALLPGRGPTGAALALIAAYGTSLVVYGWSYRRALPWGALARRARGPLALNAGLALVWLAARAAHVPALPALVVAALGYTGVAFGTGLLPRPGAARTWSAT